MTEVITPTSVLPDSTLKTRPDIEAYFTCDTINTCHHVQKQIEDRRRKRHMLFPSLSGKRDCESFLLSPKDKAFKKYNDVGDYRSPAPFRGYDNIIDPVSGFVGVGGDVDRCTNVKRMPSMVQLSHTPQCTVPQNVHSIRKGLLSAPPETNRVREWDPPAPYAYNSRVLSEQAIRSALGGWTSVEDPRKAAERSKQDPFHAKDTVREKRDQLAMKYMYTSSTQKQYEEVDWDANCLAKKWPPTHTFQLSPDRVSWTANKNGHVPVIDWLKPGTEFDANQPRYGYYGNRPMTYCSPCPRAQQIPGYSGCVGAKNVDAIDNPDERFNPFTVKRVQIPSYSQTGCKLSIPGYTGCTRYISPSKPEPTYNKENASLSTTTADYYTEKPITPVTNGHKREGPMSRMVTTVPPHNPFNKKEPECVDVK